MFKVMKRSLPHVALFTTLALFGLSGCDVYTVEPRYDVRDNLTGNYEMEEYSNTYNDLSYYQIYIRKSAYAGEIYIDNFYASDVLVHASVSYDRVTIPYQEVNGYAIEGTGTVYGSTLSLTYSVKDLYNHTPANFCKSTANRY